MLTQDGAALEEAVVAALARGVGQDGGKRDDVGRGGGNCRNAERGYRTAEARRVSRETVKALLNAVVKDGPAGMDELFTGLRAADELNNDLIRYLDNLVRTQDRNAQRQQQEENPAPDAADGTDGTADIRNVEFADGGDGDVETVSFDPSDPSNARIEPMRRKRALAGTPHPVHDGGGGGGREPSHVLLCCPGATQYGCAPRDARPLDRPSCRGPVAEPRAAPRSGNTSRSCRKGGVPVQYRAQRHGGASQHGRCTSNNRRWWSSG